MKLSWTSYRLQCKHPFGISRSSHSYYDVVYVYLIDGDFIGRGEAAPSERYHENHDRVCEQLQRYSTWEIKEDSLDNIWRLLEKRAGEIQSLKAALSMALLDWYCKKHSMRISDYFKAPTSPELLTSFTIAIGDLTLLPQKISEASKYPILKVKLGSKRDKEIVRIIRQETDKVIRVDANEGWELSYGIEMSHWLMEQGVEFIEQPFPAAELDITARLKEKSPLPIIADENSLVAADIAKIAYAFDGINIKLMKCGSLFEAKKMIVEAQRLHLKIMFGCMIESSVGITAASHLSGFVDYADLDGHILITNDPYKGTVVENGRLILPSGNGLGLSMRKGITDNLL